MKLTRIISVILLSTSLSLTALATSEKGKKAEAQVSKADHHKAMADKHAKMAECLETGKEKKECAELAGMKKGHHRHHKAGKKAKGHGDKAKNQAKTATCMKSDDSKKCHHEHHDEE